MDVTASRRCAFAVTRRVFESGAYADKAFRSEATRHGLRGRDRAFAMRLAYGVVQRRLTLDSLIERMSDRQLDELDAAVTAALRLGIYQLVFMQRVPDHAAVAESVELVKREGSGGYGLANAVLRRAVREAPTMVSELANDTPEDASLAHSHPVWIARLWWKALGSQRARSLMTADNEPAQSAVRVNTLKAGRDQAIGMLQDEGGEPRADGLIPEAIVLDRGLDLRATSTFGQGLVTPQSRAAMLVAHVLAPQAGERVLDLCAAPGGKTTHIAAMMQDRGQVVAVEVDPVRAKMISDQCERLGVSCVALEIADATQIDFREQFDRVLVDPPCSDLGTLQSRPDARWRKSQEQVDELALLQREILVRGALALRPGGRLVYSTCTISPAENELQVAGFLEEHRGWTADVPPDGYSRLRAAGDRRFLQTLPDRDDTDGFFIASLRKTESSE